MRANSVSLADVKFLSIFLHSSPVPETIGPRCSLSSVTTRDSYKRTVVCMGNDVDFSDPLLETMET